MKPLLILLLLHLVSVGTVGYLYSSVSSSTVTYDPPLVISTSTLYRIPYTVLIYGIGGLLLILVAAGLKMSKIVPN